MVLLTANPQTPQISTPLFSTSFLLATLAARTKNPKKSIDAPWPTPTLLCHSSKNKQYVATNPMRRPSHCYCWSDYAGNRVKNCTFIAVIE